MSVYLSIVVPLHNEEESIEKLLERILEAGENFAFTYEIIFVDDGSTDGSLQTIKRLKKANPQLKAIILRRNYGQTSAMVAGFEHARGEVVVTMDGDLQNDPSDIPTLLEKLDSGYDIVSGWRKTRKDHFFRVILSRIANGIISFSTGVQLHDYGCSLKAYRIECIKPLKAYGDMHRFFPALASMTGARVTEVPVTHHPRRFGNSKYGLDRIYKVFSDIFAMNLIIRFSSMPLKGFAICSLPFLLLTIFFMILSAIAFISHWTAGKATFFFIAAVLTGMAFVHLIVLGILGELVVGVSDLSHTELPEVTKRAIVINGEKQTTQAEKHKVVYLSQSQHGESK